MNQKNYAKNARYQQDGSTPFLKFLQTVKNLERVQNIRDAPTPYESNGVSYASFRQIVKNFDSLRDSKTKNGVFVFFST